MSKNVCGERLINGIVKENPTFVMMLGMCPTLAVTSSAMNGLGMGLSTTVVLILSNMLISALRKIIPDKVRIPAFIVIVASFVTIVQLLLQAYIPFYDGINADWYFQRNPWKWFHFWIHNPSKRSKYLNFCYGSRRILCSGRTYCPSE